jgi:hypothetical protein
LVLFQQQLPWQWKVQLLSLVLLLVGLYWLLLVLNRRIYHLDILSLRSLGRRTRVLTSFREGRQYVLSPADGTYPQAGTGPRLLRLDCRCLSVPDDTGEIPSVRQLLAAALKPAVPTGEALPKSADFSGKTLSKPTGPKEEDPSTPSLVEAL